MHQKKFHKTDFPRKKSVPVILVNAYIVPLLVPSPYRISSFHNIFLSLLEKDKLNVSTIPFLIKVKVITKTRPIYITGSLN